MSYTKGILNTLKILRDFVFIVLCAFNVVSQCYFLYQIYESKDVLFTQCTIVKAYSFGILINCLSMLMTVLTSICMYSVRFKSYDPLTILILTFSIIWIGYLGFASVTSIFECRTNSYPLLRLLILLAINATLGCFILYFGRKHGGRNRVKTTNTLHERVRMNDSDQNKDVVQCTPMYNNTYNCDGSGIPKLTKNYSLARVEEDQGVHSSYIGPYSNINPCPYPNTYTMERNLDDGNQNYAGKDIIEEYAREDDNVKNENINFGYQYGDNENYDLALQRFHDVNNEYGFYMSNHMSDDVPYTSPFYM